MLRVTDGRRATRSAPPLHPRTIVLRHVRRVSGVGLLLPQRLVHRDDSAEPLAGVHPLRISRASLLLHRGALLARRIMPAVLRVLREEDVFPVALHLAASAVLARVNVLLSDTLDLVGVLDARAVIALLLPAGLLVSGLCLVSPALVDFIVHQDFVGFGAVHLSLANVVFNSVQVVRSVIFLVNVVLRMRWLLLRLVHLFVLVRLSLVNSARVVIANVVNPLGVAGLDLDSQGVLVLRGEHLVLRILQFLTPRQRDASIVLSLIALLSLVAAVPLSPAARLENVLRFHVGILLLPTRHFLQAGLSTLVLGNGAAHGALLGPGWSHGMRRARSGRRRQQAADPAAETGLADAGNDGRQADATDPVRVTRSPTIRVHVREESAIQRGRSRHGVLLAFASERVTLQNPGGPGPSHHYGENWRIALCLALQTAHCPKIKN